MKLHAVAPVTGVTEVAPNVYLLSLHAPALAQHVLPGQFINIRIDPEGGPLLRRPFSVHRVVQGTLEILFSVVGRGTALLSRRKVGETMDILGPLGVPYGVDGGEWTTALLVAGGLGVAPMPILSDALRSQGKRIMTFIGARTGDALVTAHLEDVHIATDDGSKGIRGTVVELVERFLAGERVAGPKIFACGPNAMLRALGKFAVAAGIPCEVSLEGAMGCGFGICQGCPVELSGGEKKYALMCTDGPVFDVRRIHIPA